MSWVYLILGLWVAVSPWLVESFGFPLTWSNLIVGAVVALLALWGAFGRK